MLKQRILTASILAPLFLLLIFYSSDLVFASVVGLVVILAGWEWAAISGYNSSVHKTLSCLTIGGLILCVYLFQVNVGLIPVWVGVTFWSVVLVLLLSTKGKKLLRWPKPIVWVCGVFVLIPAWYSLIITKQISSLLVIFLLFLVWAADIGAYFAGKQLGKHKLAPAISPGKTLEGVIGGVLFTLIIGIIFSIWFDTGLRNNYLIGCLAIIVIVLLSVAGDLFESNWKRVSDIKDSGNILPGHGGVLDRIDSLCIAAPVFVAIWKVYFFE